ncbi:MAG: phosphoglycerate dehydrogenase [Bacteriovorax sp.]|nr:phosphoglycerate dehydrogenase [Bacteriovorax sp.]
MKVVVSTFPFSRTSSEPLNILRQSGLEFKLNDKGRKLSGEELYELAHDATAVIVGTEDLSFLIEKSQTLKLIARIGIGLDSVPLQICKDKGIKVCYTPDAVTDAVAELTLGMMISLTRQIHTADKAIRNKGWQRFEGKSLNEQTIGLLGFGRIGLRVAEMLSPFKPVKILVNDILDKKDEIQQLKNLGLNIFQVSFDELVTQSEIISLHVPKTPKTENLITEDVLSKMQRDILLINTARGGIINESDLIKFLNSGHVAGAGLDVFNKEPYFGEFCNSEKVILTQHMGSCSVEARKRMEKETVEDVIHFFKDEPLISPVDLDKEISLLKV